MADLMMSSADLLWAAKAAEYVYIEVVFKGTQADINEVEGLTVSK